MIFVAEAMTMVHEYFTHEWSDLNLPLSAVHACSNQENIIHKVTKYIAQAQIICLPKITSYVVVGYKSAIIYGIKSKQ